MRHTAQACAVAILAHAALVFASQAGAGVDLQMNLYIDAGSGVLLEPDRVYGAAVNDSVRFVLLAEMDGGPAPAFAEFTADLVPWAPCGGDSTLVTSFEFAEWLLLTEAPVLAGSQILGGFAAQIFLPGLVDFTNPVEVCSFEVQFQGGPERLVYQARPNDPDGLAFGAVADGTQFLAPITRFGPGVFHSPKIFAVGSPGDDPPCSPADLAQPFGVHDLADIQAFIADFNAGRCRADIAAPFAVLDLADVQDFVAFFVDGCF